MFRFVAILTLSVATCSVAAQESPSPDWRSIATGPQRDHVLSWDRLLESTITKAMALPEERIRGLDRRSILSLARSQSVDSIDPEWAGWWRCRSISLYWNEVEANAWRDCRFVRIGSYWRLQRQAGPAQFAGRLYPDAEIGVALLGETWERWGRQRGFGFDPNADLVGVLRRHDADRLVLHLPDPTHYRIVEIDLRPGRWPRDSNRP